MHTEYRSIIRSQNSKLPSFARTMDGLRRHIGRDQYRQGHVASAKSLLERYRHTPCVFHALQAQIEGKTYAQTAVATGRNPKSFRRHMKRAAQLLAAAYA